MGVGRDKIKNLITEEDYHVDFRFVRKRNSLKIKRKDKREGVCEMKLF